MLALSALLEQGLIEVGQEVFGALHDGFFGLRSVLLTLAFMALLRIKSPEQLGVLYLDGHVRPYHGRTHPLPKHHVQRRGRPMPGTQTFTSTTLVPSLCSSSPPRPPRGF